MSFAAVVGIAAALAGVAGYAVVGYALMAVSMVLSFAAQKRAAKKAREAAERAADAAKGFQVVQEGSSKSLALIYGRAKVGGVRVYANTFNYYNAVNTSAFINFVQGLGGSAGGSKHEYLAVQQALCISGINACYHVEVADIDSQDPVYSHGQKIILHTEGGIACPAMTAMDASRATAKFTNAAYATGIFKLNRDDPQYQGIPPMTFFVEGMRIRSIIKIGDNYELSSTLVYSNNPALCLLDYMLSGLYGRGLSVGDIDLKSFYIASKICDEVVDTVPVAGDFWTKKGGIHQVKLYELNAALDTSTSIRENISVILLSMGDADLIWSAGKFRLNLSYPHEVYPQTPFEGLMIQTGINENTHIYKCIVDGTPLPVKENAGWTRVDVEVTDNDLFIDESMVSSWPSAQNRLNSCKVTFLNEARGFGEDTAEWPPKYGRIEGPQIERGPWEAVLAYDTSDIVTHYGFIYQLKSGAKYVSATPPNLDSLWAVYQSSSVYKTFKEEDTELALEATDSLPFTSDYYHALSYAENKVRLSRYRVVSSINVSLRLWRLEPGDYIHLVSELYNIPGELYQVTLVEFDKGGFLRVDLSKFDARQLAWNAKDNEVILTRNIYDFNLAQASNLQFFSISDSNTSSGTLTWTAADDIRVKDYVVKYTTNSLVEISNLTANWVDIGATSQLSFTLPSFYSADYYFTVMSRGGVKHAPQSGWPLLSLAAGQITPVAVPVLNIVIYRADVSLPTTPVGGVFDFSQYGLTSTPAGWSSINLGSAGNLYVSYAIAKNDNPSFLDSTLDWSTPVLYAEAKLEIRVSISPVYIQQNLEGVNIDPVNSSGTAKVMKAGVDVTSSSTLSIYSVVRCHAAVCHTAGFTIDYAGVVAARTGATLGQYFIYGLQGNIGGQAVLKAVHGGSTVYTEIEVTNLPAADVKDLTPPPTPANISVSTTFSNATIVLNNGQPAYTLGHGHALTNVYQAPSNITDFALAKKSDSFSGTVRSLPQTVNTSLNLWFTYESVDGVESSSPLGPISAATGVINGIDINPLAFTAMGLADGAVTNVKIANDAITSDKIQALAVTAAELADSAVTARSIDNLAVGTAAIATGAITAAKIGTAAIGTAAIQNLAVTNALIANLSADKIDTGYLNAARIQANTITADKINSNGLTIKDTLGNIILGAGTGLDWSQVSGASRPANNATVGATIGTNLSGQFTAGNISTYVANAAIGAAQIGSIALVGTSNFSVKTAASGARMEMDSRVIKIFDSGGVLRVKIGDLSA